MQDKGELSYSHVRDTKQGEERGVREKYRGGKKSHVISRYSDSDLSGVVRQSDA